MRILLRLELDCTPDAAWRAIRSPAVFTSVSRPLTTFTPLEPGGFPELWPAGDHRVLVRAFGLMDAGTQNIGISFPQTRDGVRMMQDSGPPLAGALTLITHWHHRLAVSALPDGRTLYRDELRFNAGAATLLVWPLLWAFWQWRGYRMRSLAPSWRE